MINLRYHVVSLVAVFLALALGVLIGTTVLEEGVVDVLEGERNSLAGHRDRLLEQNQALGDELQLWESFGDTIIPDLIAGRLRGVPVVVLLQDQASDAVRDGVNEALNDAGAVVAGRIGFTDRWELPDDPTREQLAVVLHLDTTDPGELRREAAARIAARLSAGGDAEEQSDLLRSLARNGFLTLDDIQRSDDDPFPPRGTVLVLVSSDEPAAQPSSDEMLVPLLAGVQDSMPAIVVGGLGGDASLVAQVRRDELLGEAIPTVDHADTMLGELGVVFTILDEIAGRPARHFGIQEGASGIAPSIAR